MGFKYVGEHPVKTLKRFYKVKKTVIAMLNLKSEELVRKYFIDIKMSTVYSLQIYECVMHDKYKFCNFKTKADIHNNNTRSKNKLFIPQHNSEQFKKKSIVTLFII